MGGETQGKNEENPVSHQKEAAETTAHRLLAEPLRPLALRWENKAGPLGEKICKVDGVLLRATQRVATARILMMSR